jgi:hypothetical protein
MITPAGERATEAELTLALVEFLRTQAYGEAKFKTIFDNLWQHIKLSPADKEVSRERDAELKWHTIIRNIGAHSRQPGNAIHDGVLVKRRGGGYQLASRVRAPVFA